MNILTEHAEAVNLTEVVCPDTHQALLTKGDTLFSPATQQTYSVIDQIPMFVGKDDFYEGRWSEPDESTASIRNFLVKKQRFFIHHLRNQSGSILDLACGGGWKFLTKIGPVTGVDLSLGSLKAARELYDQVVQADWTKLPFADNSFDFVVSSDVLGHVPFEDKDKVLGEIYRILKPGGLTLHYIEADSHDPLMSWCKKNPELYQEYVVGQEGHIGMETASDTMKRFRKYGFLPVSEIGVYRLFMYLQRVPFLFDNEFRTKSGVINSLVWLSTLLLKNKVTESIVNLGIVGVLEITDRILPKNWSNGVLVAYRKP